MGVTSRYFASRDNLIKLFYIWVLRERLFRVQWLLASLCGLYCVHGLRVSSLNHIARCQRQLPCTVFDQVGVMDFFPSSFSLIFFRPFHHPFHPSIWFQLFACLIRAAIFHLTLAFVLLFFLYNFATGLCVQLLSWLFCCCFCFVFLPQAFAFSFFSACLALVLVFSVSLPLESFSGRQHMMSDFR